MYSLFVSYLAEDQTRQAFELTKDRFLEYTSDSILNQLQSFSVEAIDCIKSWPCIVMQEGRGAEVAHVGKITAMDQSSANISIDVDLLHCDSPVLNGTIWKLRSELDIEQFEFNRNHWAIKDRDLLPVLRAAGHTFEESAIARFENRPLPTPARSELMSARKVMAEWGHIEIDDLLLVAGVGDLVAGRNIGTRRERANAIVEFVLEHPGAKTADDSLFSAFVARAASGRSPEVVQVRAPTPASEFITTMQQDRVPHEPSKRSPNRVFIVHGQNHSARSAIVEFLTSVGLEGIVLHEQPNMGRHLLTKFIEEAKLATFAIILMTDDDVGALKGADLAPRARQNVILELGYFLAHLGQQRVCALITPELETPSDFDGIVYIRMDARDQWKAELTRELRAAEMPLTEGKR